MQVCYWPIYIVIFINGFIGIIHKWFNQIKLLLTILNEISHDITKRLTIAKIMVPEHIFVGNVALVMGGRYYRKV